MHYTERVLRHYEAFWKTTGRRCAFVRGPVADLSSSFGVYCFQPRPSRDAWTYATVGMSTSTDPVGIELHLFCPEQSDEIVELLYATAHFHRTAERLGCAHTINFGRPWLPGASCEYGFISKPYLDGPSLEWAELNQSSLVQCCWLIPITRDEREFKALYGAAAFEDALERAAVDYLDLTRPSVVASPANS